MVRRSTLETASPPTALPPGDPPFPSAIVISVVVIVIAIVVIVVVVVIILVAVVIVIVVTVIVIVVVIPIAVVVIVVGLVRVLTMMVTVVVVVQGRTVRWRGADDRGTDDVSPGSRQQAWHADDRDQENGHQQHANSPHGPHPQMY